MSRLERVIVWPVIILACLLMFSVLLIGPSHGVVECNVSPGHDGARWMWREIDGRRCWFRAQAGQRRAQDKPREELRWERRKPVTGWDHKE